jgi:sec-independent protein translocase protein TatA
MFEGLFQPMHLLVVLFIALLVFGPKKLPELGKGLGDGIRSFKDSMREKDENTAAEQQQKLSAADSPAKTSSAAGA